MGNPPMYQVAATTASVITISLGYPLSADAYEPTYARVPTYRRDALRMLDDVRDDARRWMTGRFPPPVEVELASLPLPDPEPACELPRRPTRALARVRGRRPMRGRAGRPHEASA